MIFSRELVLLVSIAVVPRGQAQSSAPGVGVSDNRIIATTADTLGLPLVMSGQTLDLRGIVKGTDTLVLRTDKGNPVWNWH
jgi:hypothetical protein